MNDFRRFEYDDNSSFEINLERFIRFALVHKELNRVANLPSDLDYASIEELENIFKLMYGFKEVGRLHWANIQIK